ncbi:hypothetical protein [Paucilactobacillus sp. N302-9]
MFNPNKMKAKKMHGFRSQLEWQWALVFSQLGWEYKYEPKQFRLKNCSYLPDFLVNTDDGQEWFEVKQKASDEEIEKCRQLSEQVDGFVYLLEKYPSPRRGYKAFKDGEQYDDIWCFVYEGNRDVISDEVGWAFTLVKHCVSSYEAERDYALNQLKENGFLEEVAHHLEKQGWHDYLGGDSY